MRVALALAALAALIGGTALMQPRGIRNHNPGNLRHGSPWQGRRPLQTDPEFVQFVGPEWGIRAMVRTLRTYRDAHGLDSVRQIISRWAPPTENATDAYVEHVARVLGVHPDEPIDLEARLRPLLLTIIRHENGVVPYPPRVIDQGIALA